MTDDAPFDGHIKISRKAFDAERGDEFWHEPREFSRWEAWCDVIQLACFAPYRHITQTGVVELVRGEFVASLRWLGARWKWTVKRVRNWIVKCEKGARIQAQRETPAGTVYLIVNYDAYQSQGRSKGTRADTPKGTAGAQQGHKREAVKAVKALTTLSDSPDEARVLSHYLATHPRRRVGPKSVASVRKALLLGYSPADLCEAIDGNANDPWHVEKKKHELDYVLRNVELIDSFRAKVESEPCPLVVDGWMSPELERLTRPANV